MRVFSQLFQVLPNFITLIIIMYILFARAIVTSTAPASSVFLSSYIHTVLSQSAHEFALGYFLKLYNKHTHT